MATKIYQPQLILSLLGTAMTYKVQPPKPNKHNTIVIITNMPKNKSDVIVPANKLIEKQKKAHDTKIPLRKKLILAQEYTRMLIQATKQKILAQSQTGQAKYGWLDMNDDLEQSWSQICESIRKVLQFLGVVPP